MKKVFTIVCLFVLSCAEATVSLSNLIETDKATCLEELEKATEAQLWDVFLEGQSGLFFDSEFAWISKGSWWQEAKNILEIGSGNGAYLYKLSQQFQDKEYKGIEVLSQSVKDANERYVWPHLTFQEGDAEVFDNTLVSSSDIIMFRFTLQHLNDSCAALENAAQYLSPNGYVVIIESYDKAKSSSHPVCAIDEALELVAEIQKNSGKGNRKITLELLQMIENKQSPLSEFYEFVSSNLDINGNVIGECVRFQGEKSRILYFNHSLLFLALVHRTYHVPVDLNRAYDELQDYVNDSNAWSSPGMHFLVLKKKKSMIE